MISLPLFGPDVLPDPSPPFGRLRETRIGQARIPKIERNL
jgi:hypothetical protein